VRPKASKTSLICRTEPTLNFIRDEPIPAMFCRHPLNQLCPSVKEHSDLCDCGIFSLSAGNVLLFRSALAYID